MEYADFFAELTGAVNAAFYQESDAPRPGEILVAAVPQARGLPFQAVAVLGLAEGESAGVSRLSLASHSNPPPAALSKNFSTKRSPGRRSPCC
jgi:hypothetical protein